MASSSGAAAKPVASSAAQGRILLVDDDARILQAYTRLLTRSGYTVDTAADGRAATALLAATRYDVVVSDVQMPEMTGLELLRAVRQHDLDVPVILMTGMPAVESAVEAIEQGAFRYLVKPFEVEQLEEAVARAIRLHQIAKAKREAVALLGSLDRLIGDRAGLEAAFDRALGTLWMAFQPIVEWRTRRIFGYEALLRSRDPQLPHVDAVLAAAERLDRLPDVGRAVRAHVADAAPSLAEATLFVNLHTKDLLDEQLFSGVEAFASLAPRVVLEITERAALDEIKDVRTRVARLRELGFRIALDDLGAGYAGLTAFAHLEPEIVKFDRELIRNLHAEPTKRKVIASMTGLCHDLGMRVVAEGVELREERDCLQELGCELLQGYLFARPAWPAPEVSW